MLKGCLLKKLKNSNGESISETLVALLISSLALVMLAGAMTAALRVVTTGREKIDAYYESSESIVNTTSGYDGSVTLKDKSGVILDQTLDVTYQINDEFGSTPVISYESK